mmetsp:Transcript_10124/g.27925  ORF Transcript_10124/g.27925 Transcript_10124/m.27925 type:complete len:87 (-) Transcript_10124:244-504(-)
MPNKTVQSPELEAYMKTLPLSPLKSASVQQIERNAVFVKTPMHMNKNPKAAEPMLCSKRWPASEKLTKAKISDMIFVFTSGDRTSR